MNFLASLMPRVEDELHRRSDQHSEPQASALQPAGKSQNQCCWNAQDPIGQDTDSRTFLLLSSATDGTRKRGLEAINVIESA